MKLFICVAIIALSSARAVQSNNDLQELVDAALDYQEGQLKREDPFTFPDAPLIPVFLPNVHVKLSAKNMTVKGVSNRVIDAERVNAEELNAQFTIRWPSIVETLKYTADGVYKNHKVNGSGDARFEINDLTSSVDFTLINVTIPFFNKTFIHIKSLNISNNLGPVSLNVTGLQAENITVAEIEEDIKQVVSALFEEKKAFRERVASLIIQGRLNLALLGKSMEDAIYWLKEHKNSKQYNLFDFFGELHSEGQMIFTSILSNDSY